MATTTPIPDAEISTPPPAATGPDDPSPAVRTGFRREVGRLTGAADGPTLICLAGLHGNEPAGVFGVERVLARLRDDPRGLQGTVVGLAGNCKALAAGRRYLDHDLNRAWTAELVARLRERPADGDAEDREQRELDEVLAELIQEASGRVFALDLHTFSGPGPAFAILDDTLPNREVALDFPVPLVLGLEEELTGTLSSYLTAQGVTVVGFEAGQHRDPRAVDRAEAAVWVALDSCGLLAPGSRTEVRAARDALAAENHAALRVVEVRYRHPLSAGDGFAMLPGFSGFQPVRAGEVLATSAAGPVPSPQTGRLLMPLYQRLGEDGFFIVRPVRPVWLWLSGALRRLSLERVLHLLPGISRHPGYPDGFVVDRRWARWLAPQLFHLLGFRRQGRDGRVVVMRRRDSSAGRARGRGRE